MDMNTNAAYISTPFQISTNENVAYASTSAATEDVYENDNVYD